MPAQPRSPRGRRGTVQGALEPGPGRPETPSRGWEGTRLITGDVGPGAGLVAVPASGSPVPAAAGSPWEAGPCRREQCAWKGNTHCQRKGVALGTAVPQPAATTAHSCVVLTTASFVRVLFKPHSHGLRWDYDYSYLVEVSEAQRGQVTRPGSHSVEDSVGLCQEVWLRSHVLRQPSPSTSQQETNSLPVGTGKEVYR